MRFIVFFLCIQFLSGLMAMGHDSQIGANNSNEGQPGRTVKGQVHHDGQGVQGVVVTDGHYFALTDKEGYYTLPYNENASHIHISSPAGFTVPLLNGVPKFWVAYNQISDPDQVDFPLIKLKNNDFRHYFIGTADPQLRYENEIEKLKSILDYLKYDISQHEMEPVHVLVAGDLVFDNHDLHEPLIAAFAELNQHVYYAIGNHDYVFNRNEAPSIENNQFADSIFLRHYGPSNYSFNRGLVHYLVLDNIIYEGGGPGVTYSLGFTRDQLEWIETNLSFVPREKAVVVVMHGPTKSRYRSSYGNSEELHALLYEFAEVQIVSGHTHMNSVLVDHTNITSQVLGTLCGAWWSGPLNTCGTPLGYKIFTVDGTNISWKYRAYDRPDSQFSVYPPGPRDPRLRPREELVVNVWDWDPAWQVMYSEDGGKSFSPMTQVKEREYDIEAFEHYGEKHDDVVPGRAWIGAVKVDHLFTTLPSPDANLIIIKVITRFGEVFTQEVKLD